MMTAAIIAAGISMGHVGDRGPLGPVLPAIAGGAYWVVRKIRGRKELA
jgi:hypothetical protein